MMLGIVNGIKRIDAFIRRNGAGIKRIGDGIRPIGTDVRPIDVVRAAGMVIAAGALGGCGFQLAGSGTLPESMQTTYLESGEQYTEFFASLSETLRRRGLTLVDSRDEAGARLIISEDLSGERVLSVSARNIPREYELYYVVTFSLVTDGQALIENEPLSVRRNYTFDETEVLGKEREESILRQALAEDLARQVVRLIEAAASDSGRTPG